MTRIKAEIECMGWFEEMDESGRIRFIAWAESAKKTKLPQSISAIDGDPEDDVEIEIDETKLIPDLTVYPEKTRNKKKKIKKPSGKKRKVRRRKYDEAFKKTVVDYAKIHGGMAAAKEFDCSYPSVTHWMRQQKKVEPTRLDDLSRKVAKFKSIKGEEALDTLRRIVEEVSPARIDEIRPFFARVRPPFAKKTERLLGQLVQSGQIIYMQNSRNYLSIIPE